MTRVYISPPPGQIDDTGGVGRVVHAQYALLPQYGVELVGAPEDAEIVAAHITGAGLPRVDVHHCHGLYWTGDEGSGQYNAWHHRANMDVLAASRQAYAITVPSDWVGMPYRRDMRITPRVIPHGIDLSLHQPGQNKGYVLWNKNRAGDVCDPTPAVALAERGAQVVTTFVRPRVLIPETLQIIGVQPFDAMRKWVSEAGVYLATSQETFGIGTIEALACGVPVLGYRHGGTADIVEHEVTGYLVRPGDIDGLARGLEWIENHRDELSANCQKAAQRYTWQRVMQQYADLYAEVAEIKRTEKRGVSVVITNYNYGQYVQKAAQSALAQTRPPDEIIVVDDGSTDDSLLNVRELQDWAEHRHPDVPVEVIHQSNQGVAAARNAGIAAATQAHIICLDADDQLDPRFIQTLLPVMQQDRALGIAYTGLKLLWPDGRETLSPFPPAFDWERQATPGNPPPTCIPSGSMFRRDMWVRAGGYQQWCAPGEDTEFWTRGLSVGFEARKVTEEPLFEYRLHEGQAHKTKTYQRIDAWHPWMRDKRYPMAAPSKNPSPVRSYSDPLVSVIIPVGRGHEQYLPAALDSLLGQTFRNWEVIVVNDDYGNWDRIHEVYPFITYLETAEASGAGAARNLGLKHARGTFTLFLDADDYLMPDALTKMLAAFVQSGGRYAYTDWLALSATGSEPKQAPEFEQRAWLEHGQHAITALLLTEDVRGVHGFDETMPGWEDWDFFIKLVLSGVCGVRVPEVLLGYRMHSGQRREESLRQKDTLLGLLRQRYGDYATGRQTMGGCCGGNGDAILAAKRALEGAPPPEMEQTRSLVDGEPLGGVQRPQTVRLEFVGDQVGAMGYRSQDGRREYRGGNNPHDKYINALPEDVEWLESFGVWRRVQRPVQPGQAVEQPPAQPQPTTWNPAPFAIPTEVEPAPAPAPAPARPAVPDENPWGVPEPDPAEALVAAEADRASAEHLQKVRRGR